MHRPKNIRSTSVAGLLAVSFFTLSANATVIGVPQTTFAGSTPTTFNGLATGTEVNGLTVNGLLFNYYIGATPTNGQVIIDGGPGTTNHIAPPNIVSIGNNAGTLTVTLPTFALDFGYGFADLSLTTLANATTIALFNGTTPVGSLIYSGSPDPLFTGGFAGIQSTLAFNRVALTFNSTQAAAFAVDNIVYVSTSPVPEPGTLLLVASGISGLIARRRSLRTPTVRS